MMKTIVCFGDSNTHGYNSKNMGRFTKKERWTGLLQEYLGEEYDVKEEGMSGRTTVFDDPLWEGLNGFNAIYTTLMCHEPVDLLIIMLGTNDVKVRFNATPENIAKGLERLVQKAQNAKEAYKGESKILIIAPPAIEPGYEKNFVIGEMGPGCVEKSRALAPLYKDVAERNHCYFLDAGTVEGIEMYPYDYMHLSLTAHEKLARKLAELIPEILIS